MTQLIKSQASPIPFAEQHITDCHSQAQNADVLNWVTRCVTNYCFGHTAHSNIRTCLRHTQGVASAYAAAHVGADTLSLLQPSSSLLSNSSPQACTYNTSCSSCCCYCCSKHRGATAAALLLMLPVLLQLSVLLLPRCCCSSNLCSCLGPESQGLLLGLVEGCGLGLALCLQLSHCVLVLPANLGK